MFSITKGGKAASGAEPLGATTLGLIWGKRGSETGLEKLQHLGRSFKNVLPQFIAVSQLLAVPLFKRHLDNSLRHMV